MACYNNCMNTRFTNRPLSWSQLSSFQYNPADWYDTYVLGKRSAPNSLMLAGSRIGDAIGTDHSPVPDLVPPGDKEYPLNITIDGIKMVGYLDHYCPSTLVLNENKCSDTKGRWTQGKVDKHKQIDMYLLLLMHHDGMTPEQVECWLNFILLNHVGVGYTVPNPPVVKRFRTERTTKQVQTFLDEIKQTVELMHQYIDSRSQLYTPAPKAPAF